MGHSKKIVFQIAISLVVCAIFILFFLQNTHWNSAIAIATKSQVGHLIFAIFSLLACFLLRLYRWLYIVKIYSNSINLQKCFTPFFSSYAINNILPLRLGDIARATLFKEYTGVAPHAVVSSLLLERIFDLSSLLVFFYIAIFFLHIDPHQNLLISYIFYISIFASMAIIVLLALPDKTRNLFAALKNSSEKSTSKLAKQAGEFIFMTINKSYFHVNPRSLFFLFSSSLLAWFFESLMYLLTAHSLGINLDSIESFLVMSLATLSTLLPSTPGYIGTYDYLCKVSLVFIGVGHNEAAAASLLMHAVQFLPITFIGLLAFIIHFGKNWRKKLRESFQKRINE